MSWEAVANVYLLLCLAVAAFDASEGPGAVLKCFVIYLLWPLFAAWALIARALGRLPGGDAG